MFVVLMLLMIPLAFQFSSLFLFLLLLLASHTHAHSPQVWTLIKNAFVPEVCSCPVLDAFSLSLLWSVWVSFSDFGAPRLLLSIPQWFPLCLVLDPFLSPFVPLFPSWRVGSHHAGPTSVSKNGGGTVTKQTLCFGSLFRRPIHQ